MKDIIKKMNKKSYLCLLLLSLTILSLATGVTAKYVTGKDGKNLVHASEFYFTSDMLKEESVTYYLSDDATSISFNVGNNADDLRFSEENINYVVTVQVDNETPTVIENNGILEKGSVKKDRITLDFNTLTKGTTYHVNATAITGTGENVGYKKVLTADFVFKQEEVGLYQYLDKSSDYFVVFTVWSKNITGDLNITFPSGLIPDNSDPIMRDVVNRSNDTYTTAMFTDKENFKEKGYSSRSYRFFIDENRDYKLSEFSAKIGSIIARDGNPLYD